MVARKKKSGSRKSAARKVAKTRKSRVALKKKVAKAPKRRVATKKKAVPPRKKQVATKKPVAAPKAAVAPRVPEPVAAPVAAPVPAPVAELDNRIAIVRANLRELVDQAASSAGAANEELLSQRISEQEERLRRLMQERDQLSQ
jgi:hypothetical protein